MEMRTHDRPRSLGPVAHRRGSRRKLRLFIRFLCTHLAILLIPLSAGTFMYRETLGMARADAVESSLIMLEQTGDTLHRRVVEIERMVTELAMNTKVQSLLYFNQGLEGPNIYRVRDTWLSLPAHQITNSLISTYYVHFRDSGILMTPTTTYTDLERAYGPLIGYGALSYEEWDEGILRTPRSGAVLPASSIRLDQRDLRAVLYVRSLPLGSYGSPKGSIAVVIDEVELHKQVRRIPVAGDSWVYIADADGRIITSLSGNGRIPGPVGIDPLSTRGFQELTIDDRDMIVTHTTSPENGWTYVAAIPSEFVMGKVRRIESVAWTVAVVIVISGLLAALLLSYWDSRPFLDLIRMLADRIGGHAYRGGSEYDYIKVTIEELIESNRDLRGVMDEQKPVLRAAFFDRLLGEGFASPAEMRAMAAYLDLPLGGSTYIVVLLQIHCAGSLVTEQALEGLELRKAVAREALSSMGYSNLYLHDLERYTIALVLEYADEAKGRYEQEVEDIVTRTIEQVCRRYELPIAFGIGTLHQDVEDIHLSAAEAKEALEYRSDAEGCVDDGCKVMRYSSIPRGGRPYYYPIETEMLLMKLTRAGERASIDETLRSIHHENFAATVLPADAVGGLFEEMKSTVLKVLRGFDLRGSTLPDEIGALMRRLDACPTASESMDCIAQAYGLISGHVEELKKSHNVELRDRIVLYLDHSYADSGLCLSMAALEFDLSEVYLSTFFKEQTGENFSVHLERIRMHHAQDLLATTGLSVDAVAAAVGYASASSFRRAFKRREGVQPTVFRDLSRGAGLAVARDS